MKVKKEQKIECNDRDCPFHGKLKTRGRIFNGIVVSKHDRRVAIEFERMIYVSKYERYARSKTKMHARLPNCLKNGINVGDLIKIQECRQLSKIINFVVIQKIKSAEEIKK
jgi:small subunit ribosomal protein S17